MKGVEELITLINESTQLIHVDSTHELTKSVISYALNSARSSRRYAKFYSNKYYINVTFQRDGTILIASNYKSDFVFNKKLKEIESYKYGLYTTTYFIWYWMNIIRKK